MILNKIIGRDGQEDASSNLEHIATTRVQRNISPTLNFLHAHCRTNPPTTTGTNGVCHQEGTVLSLILWRCSTDTGVTADYGALMRFECGGEARGDQKDRDGFGGHFYYFVSRLGRGLCVIFVVGWGQW